MKANIGGRTIMTKELFFEEYAEKCCDYVEDIIEEVFEGIRKGYDLSEDEFYGEIVENYSECQYSIMTLPQLFTDSTISTFDILGSVYAEKFLKCRAIQSIYKEYKQSDEDLLKLFEVDEDEEVADDIREAASIIRTANISEADMEELKEVMIEVLEEYSKKVYITSAMKKNHFGELLYYVLVSDFVEFYV